MCASFLFCSVWCLVFAKRIYSLEPIHTCHDKKRFPLESNHICRLRLAIHLTVSQKVMNRGSQQRVHQDLNLMHSRV